MDWLLTILLLVVVVVVIVVLAWAVKLPLLCPAGI